MKLKRLTEEQIVSFLRESDSECHRPKKLPRNSLSTGQSEQGGFTSGSSVACYP